MCYSPRLRLSTKSINSILNAGQQPTRGQEPTGRLGWAMALRGRVPRRREAAQADRLEHGGFMTRRFRRKSTMLGVLALGLTGVLSGCGGSSDVTNASSTP